MIVEATKKKLKVNKATEYIIERLKDIGINEENIEENKDLLDDIISTL